MQSLEASRVTLVRSCETPELMICARSDPESIAGGLITIGNIYGL
jgi:hypothetical protein